MARCCTSGRSGPTTLAGKRLRRARTRLAQASPAGAPTTARSPWWGSNGPGFELRTPTFLVSHSKPDDVPEGSVYTFVNGPEEALDKALAAAGDKDVDSADPKPPPPSRPRPTPRSGAATATPSRVATAESTAARASRDNTPRSPHHERSGARARPTDRRTTPPATASPTPPRRTSPPDRTQSRACPEGFKTTRTNPDTFRSLLAWERPARGRESRWRRSLAARPCRERRCGPRRARRGGGSGWRGG